MSKVKALVPVSIRRAARRVYNKATDRVELLTGRRDPLTPPRRMWASVTDPNLDFKTLGEGVKQFLIEECGLKASDAVLDVGCGIGRNAVPLITYLSGSGSYDGFDIMPEAIEWCEKNITPRHPNFRFHLADIRNDTYNPSGRSAAREYRFPFEDESFDVVFLISVFTHMLPPDMENYLSEIARVLKPGGRAMISFYLLNDASRAGMRSDAAAFDFRFRMGGGCYAHDEASPENALAYDEARVRELYAERGLAVREPITYGSWSSSKDQAQDIVVAVKT